MNNRHIVSVSDLNETDPAWALVEATLAVAFEARTANLIAFANACETASVGNGGSFRQAAERLGLGDTK